MKRRQALQILAGAAAALALPVPGAFAKIQDGVPYRRLGRTGLRVSVVGFGGLSIGLAGAEQPRVTRLLNQALDRGLNIIDTAACYGHVGRNHSESLIGAAVHSRRGEYVLSSKVGHEHGQFGQGADWSPESITRTVERSLKRLKTDYLDIVHIHGCDLETLMAGEVTATLQKARDAGMIRFLGYSGSGDRVRYAIDSGDFDVIQISLNVFEQDVIHEILPLATENDLGVIIKRPIGNAVWRYRERPDWWWYQEYWDLIEPLAYPFFEGAALDDPGPDGAGGMALRFVTSTPGIHTAIVGTTSPGRWTQNNRNVSAGPLSREQYSAIRRRWLTVTGRAGTPEPDAEKEAPEGAS